MRCSNVSRDYSKYSFLEYPPPASIFWIGAHQRAQPRQGLPHAKHASDMRDPEKQREPHAHASSAGRNKCESAVLMMLNHRDINATNTVRTDN